jgi:hypothetical protein
MTSPPHPYYVTFTAFLRPSSKYISLDEGLNKLGSTHSHVPVCVAITHFDMRPSSGRFSTCFVLSALRMCVFIAAWLHIPDISFFAIHMEPSSVTSTHFVVSAHTRVCVRVSINNYRTFRSLLLQHIPSHTSAPSPTHTSAHAFIISITTFLCLY